MECTLYIIMLLYYGNNLFVVIDTMLFYGIVVIIEIIAFLMDTMVFNYVIQEKDKIISDFLFFIMILQS